jgi:Leucine-rich repeat (LRR) protein
MTENSNELTEFPAELLSLGMLTELHLGHNQIRSIPEEISQLSELTVLVLAFNELTALPDGIGQLSSLDTLLLHENDLERVRQLLLFNCSRGFVVADSPPSNPTIKLPSLAKCLATLAFVTLHANDRLTPSTLRSIADTHDVTGMLDTLKALERGEVG